MPSTAQVTRAPLLTVYEAISELCGIGGADLAVADRLVRGLCDGSSEEPALFRGVCAEVGVGEVEVEQRQMVGDRVS